MILVRRSKITTGLKFKEKEEWGWVKKYVCVVGECIVSLSRKISASPEYSSSLSLICLKKSWHVIHYLKQTSLSLNFVMEILFLYKMFCKGLIYGVSGISLLPVHLSMLSWISFNQYSAQYYFQATGCYLT